MKKQITRRRFFSSTLTGTTGLAAGAGLLGLPGGASAVPPIDRSGPARFKLSLAAYSLRNYFHQIKGKANASLPVPQQMSMFDFIDYCSSLRLPAAELTSYFFEETSDDYFLKVRRHAFLNGITLSGTAVGNNFCLASGDERERQIQGVKDWIDRSVVLGAPHIRIFAGPRGDLSQERAKALCVEAIRECCDYAGNRGIMLGLENHGGIVAEPDELLDIISQVNHPWLGINLDSGNFHTPDPYADLERCAPYSVNVQIKVHISPRGEKAQPTDMKRVMGLLVKSRYKGFIALEHESREDPWLTIPDYLAEMDRWSRMS